MSMFPPAYEAHAVQEAIESGIERSELMATLGGRRITEVVPPHAGELPTDYAVRATGVLMVRYLAQGESAAVPPD